MEQLDASNFKLDTIIDVIVVAIIYLFIHNGSLNHGLEDTGSIFQLNSEAICPRTLLAHRSPVKSTNLIDIIMI